MSAATTSSLRAWVEPEARHHLPRIRRHLPRRQPAAHSIGLRMPRRQRARTHRFPSGLAASVAAIPQMVAVPNVQATLHGGDSGLRRLGCRASRLKRRTAKNGLLRTAISLTGCCSTGTMPRRSPCCADCTGATLLLASHGMTNSPRQRITTAARSMA